MLEISKAESQHSQLLKTDLSSSDIQPLERSNEQSLPAQKHQEALDWLASQKSEQGWLLPPLKIGNVICQAPVVLAPMASVTNPPFRLLCREMGAGLVVTEMFHAKLLIKKKSKSREVLDIRKDEHPVSVQLYGKDPTTMAKAAETVQWSGADMVDVNMGCPMRKVVGSGHGAALLRDPKHVYEIIKAMADAVDIPVTVKIRAGWEGTNAIEVSKAIEDAGGAAITIHGRTRKDMFEGSLDFEVMADLKNHVQIPIIGNGDIRDLSSAVEMIRKTHCDAVMIARGCMGYPWIFRELAAAFQGISFPNEPTLEERRNVVHKHVRLYAETYGEKKTTTQIRKHLLWYFRQTPGENILKNRLKDLQSLKAVEEAIDAAVSACASSKDVVSYPRGLKHHPNRRVGSSLS